MNGKSWLNKKEVQVDTLERERQNHTQNVVCKWKCLFITRILNHFCSWQFNHASEDWK